MSKLTVSTYDFLSVVCKELQVSPITVNAVARIAYQLFPQQIKRLNPNFIPNLWVNKILIQLPDETLGVIDAELWHAVYYYLTNFAQIDRDFYTYDAKTSFEDWFTQRVAETPELEIHGDSKFDDIPQTVTQDYVDIANRILISMYILDAFGAGPREGMANKPQISKNVVEPPLA